MGRSFIQKTFWTIALLIAGIASAHAQNQVYNSWLDTAENPIVIELFTAINCPGCDEAESIIYDLHNHKNAIVLSCPVDYLENGNWGLEECTNRQMFYDTRRWTTQSSLLVPEFVINGHEKLPGTNLKEVLKNIADYHNHKFSVAPLWTTLEKPTPQTLLVSLPDGLTQESHSVWLFRYKDSTIKKTINENEETKILRFSNVVQQMKHIGRWYGKARTIPVDLSEFNQDEKGGWVVLVQQKNNTPVVIAGKLADNN